MSNDLLVWIIAGIAVASTCGAIYWVLKRSRLTDNEEAAERSHNVESTDIYTPELKIREYATPATNKPQLTKEYSSPKSTYGGNAYKGDRKKDDSGADGVIPGALVASAVSDTWIPVTHTHEPVYTPKSTSSNESPTSSHTPSNSDHGSGHDSGSSSSSYSSSDSGSSSSSGD